VEYNAGLYRKETVDRIVAHFLKVLGEFRANLDRVVADIDILTEQEQQRLVFDWNDTTADYPGEKTIHQLFEEQARQTPDNIALMGKAQSAERRAQSKTRYAPCAMRHALSYKELNDKADQLSWLLQEKGLKPGEIGAIMMEPCFEMIIGILAILKAGGAYLPIDPEYPTERINYMLDDSGAKVLLTNVPEGNHLINCQLSIVNCQLSMSLPGASLHHSSFIEIPHHSNLAYVIYTSGTTGKPKGVQLTHRNLVNYASWLSDTLGLTPQDRTVLTSSFAFDLGYSAVYGALLNGGQLHLVSRDDYIFAESLLNYIKKNRITFLKVTPSLFSILANSPDFSMETCRTLRVVLLGGEPIIPRDVDKAHQRCSHIRFMNHYGPTETTIGSIAQFIDFQRFDAFRERPTIGKPIHNTGVYIMGKDLRLMPPGAPGELCISGDGVAKGYLNDDGLNREKFVENPYVPGERLYRVGDLARWTPGGFIEFLGRVDHQVKIRGFRIEPGEIENQLLKHDAVKETVVMVKDDANENKLICAYIVPASEEALGKNVSTAETLRNYLSRSLPDYMLPSYFVVIDAIPLTPNGKVNRRELPEPKAAAGADYVAPQNDTEKVLAEVWQGIFGVERVGVNDNFFDMGGDSIKAIQISARLRQVGLSVEVKDLFANPTINELGRYVKQVERVIPQGPVAGEVALTPVQHWFFENFFTQQHHFNLAVMVRHRDGTIDEAVLEKVLTKMVEHHDALRMVYDFDGNRVVQRNRGLEGKMFDLEVVRLNGQSDAEPAAEIESRANRVQQGMNLREGPLVKAALFKTNQGDHLLLTVHHLVVDGVSWRILLEDLSTGYGQVKRGEDIRFPEKTDSFQYWSRQLKEYAGSKEAARETASWKEMETMQLAALPRDHAVGKKMKTIKNNETLRLQLGKAETGLLLKEVHRVYNTEINDILLTALGMAVSQWAGTRHAAVNLEGHGREPIIEGIDVNRTVGWFTSHYPVVMDMRESDPLSYKLKRVKEMLRRIPNKGAGYGILKYLAPEEIKDDAFRVQPEINFNYLGQFGGETGSHEAIFQFSPMPVGDIMSPRCEEVYTFNVSGMAADGRLTLSIAYNKFEYEKTTVETLLECFRANLLAIIDHCTAKEEKELTPSDVGDEELSIEELNEIEEMIHL
jgi:amino acid adenylation domain-containing protein/non-ribosomal peptide synthase protein (TIGR01720 family)